MSAFEEDEVSSVRQQRCGRGRCRKLEVDGAAGVAASGSVVEVVMCSKLVGFRCSFDTAMSRYDTVTSLEMCCALRWSESCHDAGESTRRVGVWQRFTDWERGALLVVGSTEPDLAAFLWVDGTSVPSDDEALQIRKDDRKYT